MNTYSLSFPSFSLSLYPQFKEEYKLEDMNPADWWNKIDEIAKDNAAKGIKLPEVRPVLPSLPPSLSSVSFSLFCLLTNLPPPSLPPSLPP